METTHASKKFHPLTQPAIGYMLGHEQFSVPQLLEFGIAAERAGFDLLATSDHFQPWQDNQGHSGQAWVTLAALDQRTHSAWLGPTVTCPTLRYNPAIVAQAFASLGLLYPGRIFLGVGSGEALNEEAATGEWIDWGQRSERLLEAVALIRKLWTGDQIFHDGKYYQVNAKLHDLPPQPIPILMAANGPEAMRRAGQYADGLITDAATWKKYKDEYVAGLSVANKNIAEVPVLVEQFVSVSNVAEAKEAAELWRFLPKAFKGYHNDPDPRSIRAHADAEISIDEVLGDWVIGADAATHINAIEELFASGATIINVHSGQSDQARVIDFYGKEVLNNVRKSVSH